jgi:hypothetical protein
MPDLKPGQPVRVRGKFVKAEGRLCAVKYDSTVGHLWHDSNDVSPDADVSELVEALRECADDLSAELEGNYKYTKDHPAMKPVVRARAALAKFEAAND